MSISVRPLANISVNLSISEGPDSERHGFPPWQVNRVSLQLVSALFGQGATVVFGHDWRQDGVMAAMLSFAQQMRAPVKRPAITSELLGEPTLRNVIAWPDQPSLSAEDIESLSPTLEIEGPVLPEELQAEAQKISKMKSTSEFKYLRARALTYLREKLTRECSARVCLGGRLSGSQGFLPGVIEEALLSLHNRRPLYVSALFGGASQQIISAIEGKRMPKSFCSDFGEWPSSFRLTNVAENGHFRRGKEVWEALQAFELPAIAEVNRLSLEQQRDLFHTRSVDRVTELLLIGLSRLKERPAYG